MARKCGRCRQEGHTVKTCTEASDVQHRAETRAMDAAIVASHKPATRTCACGEITTMGAFPGRHEADECGGQSGPNVLVDRHGDPTYPEEPDPFSSPTKAEKDDGPGPWFLADFDGECDTCDGLIQAGDEIRADGSGGYECRANCGDEEPHPDESPVTDHRKWCTRCKLLGHYSSDCTTPVLDGGVVSVPEPAPYAGPKLADPDGSLTRRAIEALNRRTPEQKAETAARMDARASALLGLPLDSELAGFLAHPPEEGTEADGAMAKALDQAFSPVTEDRSDPFSTPTQPVPEVNVSGQPSARYEWYGKQNRGYLVKLPETGDFRRYKNGKPKGLTRATTFNKAATDQNALADWAKRNVLIGASKRPDVVAKAHGLTHEDNRDQLMKLVAELETTAGAKVSADVGTLIHELTERWDAGVITRRDVPAAYQGLILLYSETLKAAGLRPVPGLIERTTYIPEFGGVVGTLDRVYYHEPSGQYVIGDVKTGKTLKYGMDEIETQEWIYAHGVNNAGVYDWNTDTWHTPLNQGGPDYDEIHQVSEDWGVVVHMPVQGEDAGKVMLVRADLQRGKQHAQVCHDVRVQRANKPKPEAWTGEELKAPETAAPVFPPEQLREDAFRCVTSREHAAQLWQEAYDAGVPPEEMARLKEIADARLKGLAKAAEMDVEGTWDAAFDDVQTVKEAGVLWERARAAGVEPMELNRLVSLAQQRLRELGISG